MVGLHREGLWQPDAQVSSVEKVLKKKVVEKESSKEKDLWSI